MLNAQPSPGLLITRRVTFAAAHVLRRDEWDEERNRAVFGQCAGDHGHNYVLEVSVGGEPDPETGMVVNLKDLDQVVREAVVAHVDHRHLNHDVPFLAGVVPTAENLALAFWQRLDGCLRERSPACSLCRVRLVESENNTVEVTR
jgi:6-pyruvoyltetrahydropterin/6-carboxytetrahydropterin synthase